MEDNDINNYYEESGLFPEGVFEKLVVKPEYTVKVGGPLMEIDPTAVIYGTGGDNPFDTAALEQQLEMLNNSTRRNSDRELMFRTGPEGERRFREALREGIQHWGNNTLETFLTNTSGDLVNYDNADYTVIEETLTPGEIGERFEITLNEDYYQPGDSLRTTVNDNQYEVTETRQEGDNTIATLSLVDRLRPLQEDYNRRSAELMREMEAYRAQYPLTPSESFRMEVIDFSELPEDMDEEDRLAIEEVRNLTRNDR